LRNSFWLGNPKRDCYSANAGNFSSRRRTSSSMASPIFNLFSLIWRYITTKVLWPFVRTGTTFPTDLEHGIAENTCDNRPVVVKVLSPVPSDFSIDATSEFDFPPCLEQPPRVHHGQITFNNQQFFLLDTPNLYWTRNTISNWASQFDTNNDVRQRWCVATREDYYRALQLRASLASWMWGCFNDLPHTTNLLREHAMGPMGSYRRVDGNLGTEWEHVGCAV
jgi:hypothetical protein